MKVLSIKEPFASLVMLGIKTIETRSWKTNYRGEIYIHASSTKSKIEQKRRNEIFELLPNNYRFNEGYIICKANLTDCIYMNKEYIDKIRKDKTNFLCGRYEIGRYAWILDDIEIIDRIPAKGKLGIWNY